MEQYIDLHLHLDGAITLEIAKALANLQHISLPNDDELSKLLTVSEDCTSLTEFIKCCDLPDALMQTTVGLTEAVKLVAENIQSQGVVYAEIRFAPQFHTSGGMSQEEVVLAALAGLKETDLKANLILCLMRGKDNHAANLETLELARKYLVEDGGVVAVDLAGAEALYPTSDYRDLFMKAKEYGIPFTIHAGEAAGAKSIEDAIGFGATRIGHGVHLEEDEQLEAFVKEKGIFLEMCPTSNRCTHAIEDMSKYPLIKYLDEGIKVTLNTDDMAIEGIALKDEYEYLQREFGLTVNQKRKLLENAIEAAFTTREVKEALRKKLL